MRPVHTDTLAPGQRFGDYEVVAPVGAGTFGVVYEARTRSLGRRVALKVMGPAFSADPTLAERFRREAEIVARLHHPHVVDVYDRGEADGRMFIAMELLEGETLTQALKRSGPMPVEAALTILVPILSGVAAVHALGVVHRDLKPGNLFLTRPRPGALHPKLLDFGLVRLGQGPSDLTRVDASLGTPNYMAPEQVTRPREVDARADLWSLAVILYVMLTGERPFAAANDHATLVRVLEDEPLPPRAHRPDLPAPLEAAILKALRKDPAARHASVRAFAAAVLPFASVRTREDFAAEFAAPPGASVAPAPIAAPELPSLTPDPSSFVRTTTAPPDPPPASPRALPWIAAAAVAAVAMLAVAWFATRPRESAAHATPPAAAAPVAPLVAAPTPAPASNTPAHEPAIEPPLEPAAVAPAQRPRPARPRDTPVPRPAPTARPRVTPTPAPRPPTTPSHDPNGVPILE
ncbi:MAG: protein kinase [Polyangiales bacterium]